MGWVGGGGGWLKPEAGAGYRNPASQFVCHQYHDLAHHVQLGLPLWFGICRQCDVYWHPGGVLAGRWQTEPEARLAIVLKEGGGATIRETPDLLRIRYLCADVGFCGCRY